MTNERMEKAIERWIAQMTDLLMNGQISQRTFDLFIADILQTKRGTKS